MTWTTSEWSLPLLIVMFAFSILVSALVLVVWWAYHDIDPDE